MLQQQRTFVLLYSKTFGNIYYYNADTNHNIVSNRTTAIKYVYEIYSSKYNSFTNFVIRYYNGYYFNYILLISNNVSTISILEYSANYKTMNIWAINAKTGDAYISFSFSDDDTLFTPQDVAITDGDYGHVNGNFKRIGSILVFSFFISLTKEYSASYDAIFTFDSIRAVGRYDFASYSAYTDDLPVIDLYFSANGDNASFNTGSASTIPAGKTIFCSGTMIVTDK